MKFILSLIALIFCVNVLSAAPKMRATYYDPHKRLASGDLPSRSGNYCAYPFRSKFKKGYYVEFYLDNKLHKIPVRDKCGTNNRVDFPRHVYKRLFKKHLKKNIYLKVKLKKYVDN